VNRHAMFHHYNASKRYRSVLGLLQVPSDVKSIVILMSTFSQQDVKGVSHALVDSIPSRAVTHEPSAKSRQPRLQPLGFKPSVARVGGISQKRDAYIM
jgi:hypothetical protein